MFNKTILNKISFDDYRNSDPFPHVVIDDFIQDEKLLKQLTNNFPMPNFSTSQMKDYKKRSTHLKISDLHPDVKKGFDILYSDQFLSYLDDFCKFKLIRGVENVLCDDGTLRGAGIHQLSLGGFLNVHHDPPVHHQNDWLRPINAVLFVTPNWEKEDGGCLELWNNKGNKLIKEIFPKYNRLIIFSNEKGTYHAVGKVLTNKVRKSLLSFHYTKQKKDEYFRCYFPHSSKVYLAAEKIKNSKTNEDAKMFAAEVFVCSIANEFPNFNKEMFYKNCGLDLMHHQH